MDNVIKKASIKVDLVESTPVKEDFIRLYQASTKGWSIQGLHSDDELYSGICNSWYSVSIYRDDDLIGFGRIISDGIYQTLICDVMVCPEFQNQGIGTIIMNALLKKCKDEGIKWIQLLSAKGKQGFYAKLGFISRDAESPGMTLFF